MAGVTSPEEIKRQHDEAFGLISTMPNVGPPELGEISLEKYKRLPLQSLLPHNRVGKDMGDGPTLRTTDIPCLSTRGMVDLTDLKNLIRPGHNTPIVKSPASPTMWDEARASKDNVLITRRSHDAWGIKKIVLVFCDDFIQRVYDMPYWVDSSTGFREALAPVLEKLGLASEQGEKRIVRMLLASMPPGLTIPFHHDTGEWVSKTHRIHVPVITNVDKVLFRCGGGVEKTMKRCRCDEGRIFEMNNQAKHAVSNHWEEYRVHLILDYVDEDFEVEERIRLEKGEELVQTRRSIDRKSNYGTRPVPRYLIIGAQKAGTTSMYEYINEHPLAIRGRRRETHFFDWRWQGDLMTVKEQKEFYEKFFFANELKHCPSCLTGDSTPSYLLHSDIVIPRVKAICPWVKLIVMLRNPVNRAFSHYQMVTSDDGTEAQKKIRGLAWRGMTFEQVIEKEMVELEKAGLMGDEVGEEQWRGYLKTLPMGTGSHSLLARGIYYMQLKEWLGSFERERFLILKMEDMKAVGAQPAVDKAFKLLGLPSYKLKNEEPKNSRDYTPMSEATRIKLADFYNWWDENLFGLLGWTGGWDGNGISLGL